MIAVVVAVVLGIGTGAFAEHTRLKNDVHKTAAPTTRPTATGWFGAKAQAACPGLKRWNADAVAAYVALVKKEDWDAVRKELSPHVPSSQAALRSLIPFATPEGKAELQYLVTFHDRLIIAVEDADSAKAVFDSLERLRTAEFTRDIAVVSRAAQSCPKTNT